MNQSFEIPDYESKMAPEDFFLTWTSYRDLLDLKTFVWKNSLYIVTEYFKIFRIADSGKLAKGKKELNYIHLYYK